MNKKVFIIILLLTSILSCKESREDIVKHQLDKWSNAVIKFPQNTIFTLLGKDTVRNSIPDADYFILSYVDSIGCISCKLQLDLWKSFIKDLGNIDKKKALVLFFMNPQNKKDLTLLLKKDDFNYPICIDEQDSLNILNQFPSNMAFQTFLLDRNKKVIALGNPIHNTMIKELYMKIIADEKLPTNFVKRELTKIEFGRNDINFGDFNWQQEQMAELELQNSGKKLLVIENIVTSCGCTTVEYPKEPVQPGKKLPIKIKYKAERSEHFDKTITIYCNAEGTPFNLRVIGNAK